jgi:hypothetical protein
MTKHQIIDWIIEDQPDLAGTKLVFEENWILIRTLKPADFAAVFFHNEHPEKSGDVLALILLGIAYYRFSCEEDTEVIYFEQAWECVKDWWGPLDLERKVEKGS